MHKLKASAHVTHQKLAMEKDTSWVWMLPAFSSERAKVEVKGHGYLASWLDSQVQQLETS